MFQKNQMDPNCLNTPPDQDQPLIRIASQKKFSRRRRQIKEVNKDLNASKDEKFIVGIVTPAENEPNEETEGDDQGVQVNFSDNDRKDSLPQKSDLDHIVQKEFVEVSDHGSYDVNENNPSNNYEDHGVTTEMMHHSYYEPSDFKFPS